MSHGHNGHPKQPPMPTPSAHQLGDKVKLTITEDHLKGVITGIHFYTGKVKYDLDVELKDNTYTRLINVDSVFVNK